MKRFRFPQESLLQIKKQLKNQVELNLRKNQSKLSKATHQRDALLDQMARLGTASEPRLDTQHPAHVDPSPKGCTNVWHWITAAQDLQHRLRDSHRRVAVLESERARCVARLQKIHAEVESLELLREQHLEQQRKDDAHRTYQSMDDAALRTWSARDENVLKGDAYD